MQRLGQVLLSLVAAIISLASLSLTALANEGENFSLQPIKSSAAATSGPRSYFVFDAQPSAVIEAEFRVMNSGNAADTVRLYPVDATTARNSGTAFPMRDVPRGEVGAWLTLGASEVTLGPGEARVVPFTVTIPANVRPGEHVGGIVAEKASLSPAGPAAAGSTGAAFNVNIQHRSVIAVQLNIPGTPVERIEVAGITPDGQNGRQSLLLSLRNSSTLMLKPSGSLQLTNEHGQLVQDLALKLDTFLPQTAIEYPVAIKDQALGAGTYQANLVLSYGNNQETRYTTALAITPKQVEQVFADSKPLAPPLAAAAAPPTQPIDQSPVILIALGAGGALGLMLVVGISLSLYRRRRAAR
jgi:hypothetical protein